LNIYRSFSAKFSLQLTIKSIEGIMNGCRFQPCRLGGIWVRRKRRLEKRIQGNKTRKEELKALIPLGE
jgi:hypothetical protein